VALDVPARYRGGPVGDELGFDLRRVGGQAAAKAIMEASTRIPAGRRAAAGCSTVHREIAAELYLSEGTVKIHVGRILATLGLGDRVQVVVLAYESGLITRGS
jgi:hypothetical protein